MGVSLTVDGQTAVVDVTNSGVGIPGDEIPRIFDRFYRVSSDRPRATGGTGLGLSIALWIVSAHHGTIDVTGAVGRGSSFVVRLPILSDELT